MSNLATLKSGLAAGALLAALTSAANAQDTLLPELHRHLAEPDADRSLQNRLVGHRDERRGSARDRLLATLRRDAHLSGRRGESVRRARLAHAVPRARPGGEPPAGHDRRRPGECRGRWRIQFRRHPARRHRAHRAVARAAVRPLRRERTVGRAHHRDEIRARPDQAGIQRALRAWNATCHGGRGHVPRRGRAGLRLDHGELRDHQRLQHRARRKRTRRRQARGGDQPRSVSTSRPTSTSRALSVTCSATPHTTRRTRSSSTTGWSSTPPATAPGSEKHSPACRAR